MAPGLFYSVTQISFSGRGSGMSVSISRRYILVASMYTTRPGKLKYVLSPHFDLDGITHVWLWQVTTLFGRRSLKARLSSSTNDYVHHALLVLSLGEIDDSYTSTTLSYSLRVHPLPESHGVRFGEKW